MSEESEPLQLIHEAQFDEENSNAPEIIPEKETVQKRPDESEQDNGQRRACGLIEVVDQNDGREVFYLKCSFCDIEYQISYWLDFIDHMKRDHKKTEPPKESVLEIPVSKPSTLVVEEVSKHPHSKVPRTELELELEESEQTEDMFEHAGKRSDSDGEVDQFCFSSNESEEKIQNSDQDYAPESKRPKREQTVLKRRRNEINRKTTKENLVFFDHPEGQCVVDYLELLKSHPILWHRRQSVKKRYDEALEKTTNVFNKKWPNYQMTNEQSCTSIRRIKDLYQRVSDPSHKRHIANSTHLKKYPRYFEICTEIEENSKKVTNPCDNCRVFYFNEIDLQIHKFKRHRIGELPFKCSRCKYGFSKAENLAEHEQKHHRIKTFTCAVCNKGFYEESKLHAHEFYHTNDYKPVCEVCGEMFTTQSKYRRHRLHHEPPKEKCDICGKLYFEKWNLSEHVKSHRNEREYHCDICGKSFNHQNDVTIHKRGVHNVKPQPRKYVWVNKDSSDYMEDENEIVY